MKELIQNKLREIEEVYDVKILYAVESGSRAWGFPSEDSDYDVRFIYIHPPQWYLSIDPQGIGNKRDVIDMPINDMLDISGWEITKALRLFRKSNPPLLEWIASNIIYVQESSFIDKLHALEQEVFYPNACLQHYLNIAKNNYRKYLQENEVRIKIYFYVLRSVLACKWIEKYKKFPPTKLQELVQVLIPDGKLKDEIQVLIKRKVSGEELAVGLENKILNDYLEKEIHYLTNYIKTLPFQKNPPTEKLDVLFREILLEVWSNRIEIKRYPYF